jgi:hypothetical protein
MVVRVDAAACALSRYGIIAAVPVDMKKTEEHAFRRGEL